MNAELPLGRDRKLKFLIAHNGYLGQFEYFTPWLCNAGHSVQVIYRDKFIPNPPFPSVKFNDPDLGRRTECLIVKEAENAIVTAVGSATAAAKLREGGFRPDVIIAHCGWGTGLLLKNVWPDAVYIAYHEWFYRPNPGCEPQCGEMKSEEISTIAHNLARNFPIIAEFLTADACWCPNEFQRSQFPDMLRDKVSIFHDGVDTELFKPHPDARIDIDGISLTAHDNVVTYVGRGFEPIRKFPLFMRAVKIIQEQLPETHFVIVGENRVAYGNKLDQNTSWLHIMLDELDLDLSRIHFTGFANKELYNSILKASSAHVYLTEPFVLSWSFFESLASGCAVVSTASRPVSDFICHEENGLLAKSDDADDLARQIIRAISDKELNTKVRAGAREYICKNFDLEAQSAKRMDAIWELIERRAGATQTGSAVISV